MKKSSMIVSIVIFSLSIVVSTILLILDISSWILPWVITVLFITSLVGLISNLILIIFNNKLTKKIDSDFILFSTKHKILEDNTNNSFFSWFDFVLRCFALVFFVLSFILVPGQVEQSSMNPTLSSGDRVLIYHFSYEAKRGDIIAIKIYEKDYPAMNKSLFENGETSLVKRVAGLPGDKITFQVLESDEYCVLINGTIVKSVLNNGTSYIYKINRDGVILLQDELDINNQIKENFFFVLGDNANNSVDSRTFGLIKKESILGKIIFSLIPFKGVN
ncbi:MAG: signal peptidase I [Acholeplasmatales bacterium]|jgi:signal peptidase I|nr:signal peptidase I [Acholeplasmatales bacterium]